MTDPQQTIVPLDAAHEVLAMFGIGPDSDRYQRWQRNDGFRLVDLVDVLGESQFLFWVDWREWLPDAVDVVLDQLSALGIAAAWDSSATGEQGVIEVDGRRATIKYAPSDDDDFDEVMRSVNSLIHSQASYRKLRCCAGTDSWAYGLLTRDSWQELEVNAKDVVDLLFLPVGE